MHTLRARDGLPKPRALRDPRVRFGLACSARPPPCHSSFQPWNAYMGVVWNASERVASSSPKEHAPRRIQRQQAVHTWCIQAVSIYISRHLNPVAVGCTCTTDRHCFAVMLHQSIAASSDITASGTLAANSDLHRPRAHPRIWIVRRPGFTGTRRLLGSPDIYLTYVPHPGGNPRDDGPPNRDRQHTNSLRHSQLAD